MPSRLIDSDTWDHHRWLLEKWVWALTLPLAWYFGFINSIIFISIITVYTAYQTASGNLNAVKARIAVKENNEKSAENPGGAT